MTSDPRTDARLAFARTHLGHDCSVPIAASADAGFRSYWRSHDAHGRSVILMDSPPALEDVRPWLDVHAVLTAGGVRVPRILARDVEAGFLLLEDLGIPTLLQVIHSDNADRWFDPAFDQLLRIQRIVPPADLPVYDAALIQRELALFPEWFLGRHLGLDLQAYERSVLDHAFAVLEAAFGAQAQIFVHRDFMPRNLMPHDDGVVVIDFQGALRGPLAYDVVSLFKDAYQSWPQVRIDGWITRYGERARAAGLPIPDDARFRRDVDLCGVQRHLKILGIFSRLNYRDGKPRYLTDVARFLAYLDATLPAYSELAALHSLLREHVFPRLPPLELPR